MNKERKIVQEEALKIIQNHKRCGLGISMGVGKTRIAIKHLQINYNPLVKALVVIPKLSIKESWLLELKKMNLEDLENHLTFTTYLSINKQDPLEYDIVYLDECHSLLEIHDKFLSEYDGKILGLTGTPPVRKGTKKYMMVERYCPIVYKYSVDDAVDANILNNYQIIVHELMLSGFTNLKKKNRNGGYWYTSEYKDYKYFNARYENAVTDNDRKIASIMRMRSLMDYNSKEEYVKLLLTKIKSKCIVFANTQDQANRICKHSYHSNNPSSEENFKLFDDGRIEQMSCVLQLSEGVTIKNLKQGIIMHAYGNERKTAQRINIPVLFKSL